ncbi:MAG TPA: S-layer homology domain-containing protein, partial [Bacillota bacterium]|nr:S-layer homology domain-containing protein [Bacillota bacterium]
VFAENVLASSLSDADTLLQYMSDSVTALTEPLLDLLVQFTGLKEKLGKYEAKILNPDTKVGSLFVDAYNGIFDLIISMIEGIQMLVESRSPDFNRYALAGLKDAIKAHRFELGMSTTSELINSLVANQIKTRSKSFFAGRTQGSISNGLSYARRVADSEPNESGYAVDTADTVNKINAIHYNTSQVVSAAEFVKTLANIAKAGQTVAKAIKAVSDIVAWGIPQAKAISTTMELLENVLKGIEAALHGFKGITTGVRFYGTLPTEINEGMTIPFRSNGISAYGGGGGGSGGGSSAYSMDYSAASGIADRAFAAEVTEPGGDAGTVYDEYLASLTQMISVLSSGSALTDDLVKGQLQKANQLSADLELLNARIASVSEGDTNIIGVVQDQLIELVLVFKTQKVALNLQLLALELLNEAITPEEKTEYIQELVINLQDHKQAVEEIRYLAQVAGNILSYSTEYPFVMLGDTRVVYGTVYGPVSQANLGQIAPGFEQFTVSASIYNPTARDLNGPLDITLNLGDPSVFEAAYDLTQQVPLVTANSYVNVQWPLTYKGPFNGEPLNLTIDLTGPESAKIPGNWSFVQIVPSDNVQPQIVLSNISRETNGLLLEGTVNEMFTLKSLVINNTSYRPENSATSVTGFKLLIPGLTGSSFNGTLEVQDFAGNSGTVSINKQYSDGSGGRSGGGSGSTVSTTTYVPPLPNPFIDMDPHWAQGTVVELAYKKILAGYPDLTFRPDISISRVEAATILVRAFGLSQGSAADLTFTDNSDIPLWAQGYIATAVKEGIIKGYTQADGTTSFAPNNAITRAELGAIISRLIEKKYGKVENLKELPYSDKDQIPQWAARDIQVVYTKGVLSGYPDNTLRINNNITRAESAVLCQKAIKLAPM